jgi:hypothetical protein
MAFGDRWGGVLVLPATLALTVTTSAFLEYDDRASLPVDRDNLRWRDAIRRYSGRYEGLTAAQEQQVRIQERRFASLLDQLTAMDGMGSDHGKYHQTKPEREAELWALLGELPNYPGAPRLVLAAIDDVYLGFHGNGWWGYGWHWPYLDCAKAVALADRLAALDSEFREEALWTKIYCYRVQGWAEFVELPGPTAQEKWKSDERRARALCDELLKWFPEGKYASRVKALMAEKKLLLQLPGYPVMGRTPSGLGGYSHSERRYDGPEFQIVR